MDTSDIAIIGIAGALILLTKNPVSDLIKGVESGTTPALKGTGNAIGEIAEGIASPFGALDATFDRARDIISGKEKTNYQAIKGQTTQQILDKGDTIFGLTGEKIVQNIESSARQSMNTTGKAVVVTPIYDKASGTGVSASGFGYSSAFNLGNKGTGTTFTNTKTGSTVKRGVGSFLSNTGFN